MIASATVIDDQVCVGDVEADHDPCQRGWNHACLARPGQEHDFFARPGAATVREEAGEDRQRAREQYQRSDDDERRTELSGSRATACSRRA